MMVEPWNEHLLDYPTVRRDADGEWLYFVAEPTRACADMTERDFRLGCALARETLRLAGRSYEADTSALSRIVVAALEICGQPEHRAYFVAQAFVEDVLVCAVQGEEALRIALGEDAP